MAQWPAVLEHLIFVSLGVLDVERSLKPSKRPLTSVFFFNFLEDFQAVLYELCCLLREVIHFLSAPLEKCFPTEFVETSQTFPATQSPTPTTVSTMRPICRGGTRRKFFSR